MSKKEWVSLVVALVLLGLVCVYAHGCQTVKGVAHDSSWALKQIDKNIAPPTE